MREGAAMRAAMRSGGSRVHAPHTPLEHTPSVAVRSRRAVSLGGVGSLQYMCQEPLANTGYLIGVRGELTFDCVCCTLPVGALWHETKVPWCTVAVC